MLINAFSTMILQLIIAFILFFNLTIFMKKVKSLYWKKTKEIPKRQLNQQTVYIQNCNYLFALSKYMLQRWNNCKYKI